MIKRLFLLAVILLVALPASFSVLAQDDLTETLELEDFGFTMSYPDGWTEAGDINDDGFVALLEDEDDFENATDFASLNGQVVIVIAAPEEALESLGEDAGERLSSLAESFDADLSARDVEEVEIAGGYPTAVGAPEVDDAFVVIAEVNGEQGFAFFLIGAAPADAAEDLLANLGGMLDSIEIGEGSGGDEDEDEDSGDTGDAETIEYGDTVEGEISDDTPAVIYTFEASEGDVVTITMVDTSRDGGLDPYVGLLNEDGDVIAENDDAEDDDAVPDSFDSQIAEFEIEEDGTYFVVATRFGQDNGSSEGDYELTIEEGSGGGSDEDEDEDEDSGDSGDVDVVAIEYGDTVEGEVTDDTVYSYFSFEASEGDVVTITMVDTSRSGELDPYVGLADESGEIIAENDDADSDADLPDSFDSQITEFEIEEDGVYTIIATRYGFEDGSGEGEFEITLEEGG